MYFLVGKPPLKGMKTDEEDRERKQIRYVSLILIEKSKEHKNISQHFKLPGLDHNEYSSCSCESIILFAINLIHITTL